ncbi:MAG: 2-hydroxy-3-oxopropionate reductase [Ruminococcaceae bacterium]|jgi:2-hydroxy-3-oxopropionate reductase|nr:2-hydroxy-3-oxopropionate reductase [Oscillospiraceae bacterium]
MKIGFIGMGIMGRPMALNLLRAGHDVMVSNRSIDKCAPAVSAGGKTGTYAEAAAYGEILITMLPNSPQVREVVLGAGGAADAMRPGQVLVDMSSINPLESRAIAAELAERGIEMLDAPVSGGEPKAVDGTLSIMAGGRPEIFERCREVLGAMGSSVVYCGDIGAGNTTKLANQVIVAANIAAVAEGFMLARKAGVDPNVVFSAIRGGLAGSTVMEAKGPMMLANNVQPGFKIDLHIKDLDNALQVGHATGAPLPMTANVMELLQNLRAGGLGGCDHSALAKYYEKLAGTNLF